MSHRRFAMDYNYDDIVIDAHLSFSCLHPQVAPGAALLMRIVEDFIHLIGEAQKPFQSFLVVTNNLSKCHTMLPRDVARQRQIIDYFTPTEFKGIHLFKYFIGLRSDFGCDFFTILYPQSSSAKIFFFSISKPLLNYPF